MGGWNIFYMGWWISWAPFVGTFIAKVYRGRTVRESINTNIIGPFVYVLKWFKVFGAIRIKSYCFSQLSGNTNCDTPKMSWNIFKLNFEAI